MKPCKTCPFMRTTKPVGAPDWLELVALNWGDHLYHSCHRTDPRADGYVGAKKKRNCVGYDTMLMNDHDKTPGKGGVWNDVVELMQVHLDTYQRELA